MAVRVTMRRVANPEASGQLDTVLRELRILAMSRPGYISAETLRSEADQCTTLVIARWELIDDWKEYEDSPRRREILHKLEPLLAQPTTTEVWLESPVTR